MATQLTDRQQEVYDYLVACSGRGRMPTVREIGKRFGIVSPNGVRCNLLALQRKGKIRLENNSSRGIVLVGRDSLADVARALVDAIDNGAAEEEIDAAFVRLRNMVKPAEVSV